MGVITTGTVSGIRSLRDKTIRVTVDLQEMDASRMQQVFNYIDQYCKIYITTEGITKDETDLINSEEIEEGGKTMAQRLRAVLYRYWEQDKKGYDDSELFYRFFMDKIIQAYKDKLE